MNFSDGSILHYLANVIDILVVWFVIYKLIMLIRGTKAVQLLKGIFIIVIVKLVSSFLGLQTVGWITDQILTWGFLAIIIIFQPELRRALETLGRGSIFTKAGSKREKEQQHLIDSIEKSVSYMGKRRIGALISVERGTGLDDYIETGIALDADISSQLLINIFIPNTPLHDGAVIIKSNKIAAAAGYLPLSDSPFLSKELGTRHRAALGISEVTDSITIVVSEETGGISITKGGELFREVTPERLHEILEQDLVVPMQKKPSIFSKWKGGGKK
ncbi:TIGR00159 family protein [Listeria weihenstephanensis]|uniref:Diadenylate cyclase n=1 Tax=Listeria weihenstephanensis TaxID=1006155 RepID=A0A841Z9A9_9LIST|nr:diadenylate cyclase CdaA [Listeria weihenstephanensis]MBC1501764.1 TIGR00159 family protein [Listeria weihenstephanensis]